MLPGPRRPDGGRHREIVDDDEYDGTVGVAQSVVDEHDTDPLDPDTDDGGVTDGDEVEQGTDPRDNPLDDYDLEEGNSPLLAGRYLGGACSGCNGASTGVGGTWAVLLLGIVGLRRRRRRS